MTHNVGLAVVRAEPFGGHGKLVNEMIWNNETVIIALGSAGAPITKRNPWNIETRQKMIRNVYGDRVKIIPLPDIGADQASNEWVDFVLSKIKKVGLPSPTRYYTGSEADAIWYQDRFYHRDLSYWKPGVAYNNTKIPEKGPNGNFYTGGDILRELLIIDRYQFNIPSATEIRTMIETRSDRWKQWVPEVNHELVESTYPDEFRVRLDR